MCQNEVERGRARKKRREFMKQILEGIYFKITGGIQELGTYMNHDVELKLRTSCEVFRVDMGDQIGRLKEAQQNMAQGVENVVSDVDTRLIQNDHRNTQLGELLKK